MNMPIRNSREMLSLSHPMTYDTTVQVLHSVLHKASSFFFIHSAAYKRIS